MNRIHKLVAVALALSASFSAIAAPSTWISNGHQYEVIASPSTSWDDARTAAMGLGSGWDLATITSLGEQNFITSLIGPANGNLIEYYIGGTYSAGAWGWVTNEAFSFTYWGGGEPNCNACEPHIALDGRYNFPNWGWNDYTGAGSTFVAGYVVEHTAPVPEPETYAMMLAGLGLLGFAARRKRAPSA